MFINSVQEKGKYLLHARLKSNNNYDDSNI